MNLKKCLSLTVCVYVTLLSRGIFGTETPPDELAYYGEFMGRDCVAQAVPVDETLYEYVGNVTVNGIILPLYCPIESAKENTTKDKATNIIKEGKDDAQDKIVPAEAVKDVGQDTSNEVNNKDKTTNTDKEGKGDVKDKKVPAEDVQDVRQDTENEVTNHEEKDEL